MNRRSTYRGRLQLARTMSAHGFLLARISGGVQHWHRDGPTGDKIVFFGDGEKCVCWSRVVGEFAAPSVRDALRLMKAKP